MRRGLLGKKKFFSQKMKCEEKLGVSLKKNPNLILENKSKIKSLKKQKDGVFVIKNTQKFIEKLKRVKKEEEKKGFFDKLRFDRKKLWKINLQIVGENQNLKVRLILFSYHKLI